VTLTTEGVERHHRWAISSAALAFTNQVWIECVTQTVAQRAKGEHGEADRQGGRPGQARMFVKMARLCYHHGMTAAIDLPTLTRRTIINMARRRQRPGSGSSHAFLQERTSMMQWPDLTPVLSPILWAVVGATATRLYMPERYTRDLNIVVDAQDIRAVKRKLSDAGYVLLGTLSISGMRWQSPAGVSIDIIEGADSWWPAALQAAQTNRDGQGLPVLPLPYLVLMKFNASRTIDLGDIARMLGLADEPTLAQVRDVFRQFAPDGLEDLESLIVLGKLELDLSAGS
jgi:hypothetical protein